MSRTPRLAAYAAVLVLVFGGGAVLGAALGPEPSPAPRGTSTLHGGDSTHGSEH